MYEEVYKMRQSKEIIRRVIICVIFAFLMLDIGAYARAEIEIGADREKVIATLGEPQGKTTSGNEEILSYSGMIIILNNGKVAHIDKNAASEETAFQQKSITITAFCT